MRAWYALHYALWLVKEIFTGAATVAHDALTPGHASRPKILEYPLRCETDVEITVMASSITITPGTLTLGIAPAGNGQPATLFVHAMYAEDLVADLDEMQRRLLRATRGREVDA
ncbi:Na+/H+ antiporter subunit E [Ornithinicoccus halotolerans]|uniref:Na+/H+ antiporter subunit E n=1 Tax=Ornithinicoccus halotolerans TaxID=1748220 RepID=UPI00129560F9|nr:Na+/H+ antiporter subunit E [Ornithinicoccus halotolerans]